MNDILFSLLVHIFNFYFKLYILVYQTQDFYELNFEQQHVKIMQSQR